MKFLEVILLGTGLATDASCVSTTNGLLYRPQIKIHVKIARIFAIFQFLMPVVGFLGASLLPQFIYRYNNIIAFILLCFIGVKMISEAYSKSKDDGGLIKKEDTFTNRLLYTQGIATSIDALSIGFAFSELTFIHVIAVATIIALITFSMCFIFVYVGIYIGNKINTKVEFIGGVILILMGISMLF